MNFAGWLRTARVIVYASVPALYTANLFVGSPEADVCIAAAACLSILMSFGRARQLYRAIGIVFLAAGAALFLAEPIRPETLTRAFHPMAGVLGLFLVLPFIQGVVRVGKYDAAMSRLLLLRVRTLHGVYCRASLGMYMLSVFLAIAAIPIGTQSFGKNVPGLAGERKLRYLNRALVRPFALALLWSPVEMLVVVGVDATGADYASVFPLLFGFSFFVLAVEWGLRKREYGIEVEVVPKNDGGASAREDIRSSVQLIAAIALLFAAVAACGAWLKQGMIVAIVCTLAPFTFIWSLGIRKSQELRRMLRATWAPAAERMADFNVLFLSAGFLFTAFQASPAAASLNRIVVERHSELPLLAFCLFVSLLLWGLTYLGMHPVVSLALMAEVMRPMFAGQEAGLAFLLIASLIVMIPVNPFNVVSAMLTSGIGLHPFAMVRWNIGHALGMLAVVDVTACLLLSR